DAVLAVEDVDAAESQAGGWIFIEEMDECGGEVGEPEIVGVEERQDRAGGELHAGVAGPGGAAVLLAVEDEVDVVAGQFRAIGFDDAMRMVGRAIVDDDGFKGT